MGCRYYDDALTAKIKRWIPDNSNLRVLKPEESKRLFEVTADDNNDGAINLPMIALSRNNDIELLSNVKQPRSYDGVNITPCTIDSKNNVKYASEDYTIQFNVIPIKLQYQLDIYTKTYQEGDEYLRTFLFKLINNPVIRIEIPYNDTHVEHIANIRVLDSVSDTSAITERIFSGQFTRWTIQLEIQDAFFFSIPYRQNWKLYLDDGSAVIPTEMYGVLELSNSITEDGEIEPVDFYFKKG